MRNPKLQKIESIDDANTLFLFITLKAVRYGSFEGRYDKSTNEFLGKFEKFMRTEVLKNGFPEYNFNIVKRYSTELLTDLQKGLEVIKAYTESDIEALTELTTHRHPRKIVAEVKCCKYLKGAMKEYEDVYEC